ncbi:MAG: peptide/nickel transport system substrate-binding protein [Actinomycetota bacterium]|nr:peptide/nickel transport system substrate-binding protein [Actinomycetota bacterium]
MRKSFIGAFVASAVVLAACGGSGSSSTTANANPGGPIKDGGTLRVAAYDGIDSMNPFIGVNDDSYATYEYIYPQLVQYDANQAFAPDFALSWTHSKDGLAWTFKTQPNAVWSDGKPLTAADAAFTYNTMIKFQDTVTAGSAGSIARMTDAKAIDDTTLVIHFSAPEAAVLGNVQQVSILPEHIWAQYAAGDGKALKEFANTPTKSTPVVSGGPFMVTQYDQTGTTIFMKNPHWYGTAPHIAEMGLEYFSNEDAEVTALKTNSIDAIESVPPPSVKTLQDANLTVKIGPSLTYRTFIINSSPYKTKNPELQDPQVRMAFEYAIDRASIIKTAWLGYAQPGTTIVPPGSGSWFDSSIKPLPFDINQANSILDGLNFTRGSDGIRVANGHPMTYEVLFPGSERGAGDRAFQIIQSDFQQIGVKLIQKPVTGAYSIMTAPDNKYENWDLAMWSWTPPIDPDFILSAMTCQSLGNWSDSGYCKPAYDKLYAQQGKAVDPTERHDLVNQAQQMVFDDRPYIILNYNDTINAWNGNFTGYVESSQGFFGALTKQSLIDVHQA